MPGKLSGKYAIAGLGMVIGVPVEQLAKRREMLPEHPMLGMAIGTPLNGLTTRELEAEAARRAIEDAGLTTKDIDGAVHVQGGPRSGSGATEQLDTFARMLGLPVNFYYIAGRGGAWGTIGIITALSFLELGIAKYVVIAGSKDEWSRSHRKELREQGFKGQIRAAGAPEIWGPVFGRIGAVHEHSMFASRHMYEYGTTERQFGAAAIQIRAWACKNPLARMYGKPATIEDYEKSPIYVWPFI